MDAVRAGPSGLPKKEDGINTFLNIFDRLGFNQEDMIALVACGHTLGGVHHADFPELVDKNGDPAKPWMGSSNDRIHPFDLSPHNTDRDSESFDNRV